MTKVFLDLLQNRAEFVKGIREGANLKQTAMQLGAISVATFGLFGLIIGSQHSAAQAVSSAVKLPLLFLLTITICVPTLFIFGAFLGSKQSLGQIFVLLLAGTSVTGIALAGFAPVTLFFIVTTRDYQFFKILNVFFFALSGLLGIAFFARTQGKLSEPVTNQQAQTLMLRAWFLLYAFVGTQLAWTLRPFFGSPELPFEIFRQLGGNFYADMLQSIGHVFGKR